MMVELLQVFQWALLLWGAPAAFYLGFLTLMSRRLAAPLSDAPRLRFAVVVPAHNEEAQIASTVASLLAIDYPKALYRVVVVADNCTDRTAQRAADAHAEVFVRQHATDRGKGFALHHAFVTLLEDTSETRVDAFVVVDADSIVSRNLLQAFAARLERGAWAVQADYGVRNQQASWRTRLMAVALAIFHRVRGLGRERLKLSAGLRGNGMCFSRACLSQFPHEAHGLVEDVEYGILLGLGGARIAYADEAQVLGEMVSGAQGSESQRQRWESGRAALKRQQLPKLLREAVTRRSAMLLDLAVDLAVPPLATLALVLFAAALVEGLQLFLGANVSVHTWVLLAALISLCGYVARGMVLSGLGMGAVTALIWAPVYVGWKVLLRLLPSKRGAKEWVRTEREGGGKNNQRP